MMSVSNWLVDQEDHEAKEKSLRRLGDEIVRLVYAFDELLNRRSRDPLKCELGRVDFPRVPFDEEMLLRFYERFESIQQSVPPCQLCDFKERQRRSLIRQGIDLYGPAQRSAFRANKGYVTQAERLEQAAESTETAPKCRWCERLGDSVIALHAHPKAALVTADRSFVALGQILNREVRQLPSLAALKRGDDTERQRSAP